jgi:hypothetical protein
LCLEYFYAEAGLPRRSFQLAPLGGIINNDIYLLSDAMSRDFVTMPLAPNQKTIVHPI